MSLDDDIKKARENFDNLYDEVRLIIIKFQLESPKAPRYASGFIDFIRNAHDDCILGYRNKQLDKIANAVEHLSIAGLEALELILLDKMKEILEIHRQINFFLFKVFYPEEVFSLMHNIMVYVRDRLIQGKLYKSRDFHRSKKEFQDGITRAENILKRYYSKEIIGLNRAERRVSWFITYILGILSGLSAGFILGWVI